MQYYKFLYIILFCFTFNSCFLVSFNENNSALIQGMYCDYKYIDDSDIHYVNFLNPNVSIDKLENDKNIYAINATHLKNYLKSNPKTIVYTWSPHCKSPVCIRVQACQDYATQNGYALIVIADYYLMDAMKEQNVALKPMFIVNHKYYKSNLQQKYNKRFWKDFDTSPNFSDKRKKSWGRFLIFNKDSLVEIKDDLLKPSKKLELHF